MKGARSIFRFLIGARERGEGTALVTITDVIGRSSRAPGSHMAVSETGAFEGSLSGGCVEAAVVGEAKRIIGTGKAELVRFGQGSPFIDIRLPCGGGLDLLILPDPPLDVLIAAARTLDDRLPVTLRLKPDGPMKLAGTRELHSTWHGKAFLASHRPDLHLFIIGHGAETEALAGLALAYGAQVTVLSPDETIVEQTSRSSAASWRLKTPARSPHLAADPYSAIVMLFHDHDWETELLAQALEQEAFFIGAMGSRATQARRLDALRKHGVPDQRLARLVGPIGLIPAARNPDTLALSVLSEVVSRFESEPIGQRNNRPRLKPIG
jgi:xanthine dehydrogenase accessory factor